MIVPFDYLPKASQGVSQVNNTEGDAFYIVVDGKRIEYELDNNSTVGAGRVRVPMGGDATATVTNIVTVVEPLLEGKVQLYADGAFLDVVARDSNIDLQMGLLAGGSLGGGIVSPPQRVLPTACVMIDRVIYAQDVTRGKVRVYHQMDNVSFANVNVVNGTTLALIPWTGTLLSFPGHIDLVNGGATPYIAGNWVKLIVIGDKYE